jgi:hypothetical protein
MTGEVVRGGVLKFKCLVPCPALTAGETPVTGEALLTDGFLT